MCLCTVQQKNTFDHLYTAVLFFFLQISFGFVLQQYRCKAFFFVFVLCSHICWHQWSQKARGLAQHGGPPGWLEYSDPAGVILYVTDGPYCLLFPHHSCNGCPDRSCPAASWWNFQLLLFSKCTQPSVMSYTSCKEGMAWYSSTHAFYLADTAG